MNDEREVYNFFDWISGGLTAASLAFFAFAVEHPSDHVSKQISIALFMAAMPLLLGASSVSKDIYIYSKSTKESNSAHNILLAFGVLAFISGLAFLCFLTSGFFLVASLLISFVVSLGFYIYSYNSLVKKET